MCRQHEIMFNDFKTASITEAVESTNTDLKKIDNLFGEQ